MNEAAAASDQPPTHAGFPAVPASSLLVLSGLPAPPTLPTRFILAGCLAWAGHLGACKAGERFAAPLTRAEPLVQSLDLPDRDAQQKGGLARAQFARPCSGQDLGPSLLLVAQGDSPHMDIFSEQLTWTDSLSSDNCQVSLLTFQIAVTIMTVLLLAMSAAAVRVATRKEFLRAHTHTRTDCSPAGRAGPGGQTLVATTWRVTGWLPVCALLLGILARAARSDTYTANPGTFTSPTATTYHVGTANYINLQVADSSCNLSLKSSVGGPYLVDWRYQMTIGGSPSDAWTGPGTNFTSGIAHVTFSPGQTIFFPPSPAMADWANFYYWIPGLSPPPYTSHWAELTDSISSKSGLAGPVNTTVYFTLASP